MTLIVRSIYEKIIFGLLALGILSCQSVALVIVTIASSNVMAQESKLNCLTTNVTGPQDGRDINKCSRVLVSGTEIIINCLSKGADGPRNRANVKVCKKVVTANSSRAINCLSNGTAGPQDSGARPYDLGKEDQLQSFH